MSRPTERPTKADIQQKRDELKKSGAIKGVKTPARPKTNLTEKEKEVYEVVKNPNGTYRIRRKDATKGTDGVQNPVPTTPANRKREGPICGAPKNQNNAKRKSQSTAGEGVCCMPAGWGTQHPGYGRCKYHGGNSPSHNKHAAKRMIEEHFLATYGEPIDITPSEALLQEVQRTAGHVEWLNNMIRMLADGAPASAIEPEELAKLPSEDVDKMFEGKGNKALMQATLNGIEPSVWLKLYMEERQHLIRAAKLAIDAGVAERQVRLAEEQGMLLAMVIRNILTDPRMKLTPEQVIASREVTRYHLTSLPSGQPDQEPPTSVDDDIVEAEIIEDSP